MKKITLRILLIVAAIFLLFAAAYGIYAIPMFFMDSVQTGRIINTNIYALNNTKNTVYLMRVNKGYVMIDAGLNSKKLKSSLEEINIDTNEITSIFITHSDGDHVAALALFPNADIYMSKDEIPLINGEAKRIFFGGNRLPSGIGIERIIPLSNGQELTFNGTKIKCISAPGHTTGSMLYLLDDRYLFTGDAFKIRNKNISVHPYSMNTDLSKKIIEEMRDTINKCQAVFTSHYGIHNLAN